MALLGVPIHLQDRLDLCGPACAQMVTRFLGSPITPQDASTIGQADPAWFTTPTQLETLINRLKPASVPRFKVFVETASAATAAMAHVNASLAAGYPPVVLANGGEHWVVVRGLTGTSRKFVHFRDPMPDRPLVPGMPSPLPAHRDNDSCDEGDQLGGGGANSLGQSDEAVSWSRWKSDWFTKCAWGVNTWKGKRVVIAADLAPVPVPEPVAVPVVMPSQPLTEASAITFAREGLEASGLLALPEWAQAWSQQTTSARAVRVESLDRSSSYFLVAITDQRGQGVLTQVDAATGEVIGVRLNPGRVVQGLLKGAPAGHVRYVWALSPDSFYSPYFVFSERKGTGGVTVYERLLDRQKFPSLKPPYTDGPKRGRS